MGVMNWDELAAAIETPAKINVNTPERVLVLDLIARNDPIRSLSDTFASVSSGLSQDYTYACPVNARELRDTIQRSFAAIVVLDTHGEYRRVEDEVFIGLPDGPVPLNELLPDGRVPPVWILSACDTSVTGAVRGCVVRRLLSRGAVCVIATLSLVDAFTASMFVGRLLTDLYHPVKPGTYDSFDQLFFWTQYTTALLYDPLLPLLRRSERDRKLRKPLGRVLNAYYRWAANRPIEDARRFRHEATWCHNAAIAQNGLTEIHQAQVRAGHTRPETLFFSLFGAPSQVDLVNQD